MTVAGNIKNQIKRTYALTDAATIAVNSDIVDIATVTLGGDRTLGTPTGSPVNGQVIEFNIKQDGTGGRTLAASTGYSFYAGSSSFLLSPIPGSVNYFAADYHSDDGKWWVQPAAGSSSSSTPTGFGVTFGDGVTNITSGVTAYLPCPFAATITGYTIWSDAGTCTITTWKIAKGTALPTVANSISTSGVSLSSGRAVQSNSVTDFTNTSITANDILGFHVQAVAGSAKKIGFQLELLKS